MFQQCENSMHFGFQLCIGRSGYITSSICCIEHPVQDIAGDMAPLLPCICMHPSPSFITVLFKVSASLPCATVCVGAPS